MFVFVCVCVCMCVSVCVCVCVSVYERITYIDDTLCLVVYTYSILYVSDTAKPHLCCRNVGHTLCSYKGHYCVA